MRTCEGGCRLHDPGSVAAAQELSVLASLHALRRVVGGLFNRSESGPHGESVTSSQLRSTTASQEMAAALLQPANSLTPVGGVRPAPAPSQPPAQGVVDPTTMWMDAIGGFRDTSVAAWGTSVSAWPPVSVEVMGAEADGEAGGGRGSAVGGSAGRPNILGGKDPEHACKVGVMPGLQCDVSTSA
jgi:hypothetical protein